MALNLNPGTYMEYSSIRSSAFLPLGAPQSYNHLIYIPRPHDTCRPHDIRRRAHHLLSTQEGTGPNAYICLEVHLSISASEIRIHPSGPVATPCFGPIRRTLQVRLARMAMYYYAHPKSRHVLVLWTNEKRRGRGNCPFSVPAGPRSCFVYLALNGS